MTRDEAKQALKDWQEVKIDAIGFLERLGLLELDEPKSEDARLAEALGTSFAFDTDKSEMAIFREQLALRGLRIVEK